MRKIFTLCVSWLLVASLAACSTQLDPAAPSDQTGTTRSVTQATSAASVVATPAASVSEALAEKSMPTEVAAEQQEGSATSSLTLRGSAIAVDGPGVTVEGGVATITAAGTYNLAGTLDDGQIVVDTADQAAVRLVLGGVTLHSSTSAPLYIKKAEVVEIVLAEGTQNTLSDGTSYVVAAADQEEPNAALFSAADLSISGSGALTVQGNFNDGIASKDGLSIAAGTLAVTAADDGIRGKDYLVVRAGSIAVTAQGDGLKADNAEDATKGYLLIEGGAVDVTSGGDALTAATDVLIAGGELNLAAGGGSGAPLGVEVSAKGIKATANLTIDGGTIAVDAADDALHANGSLTINDGAFALASGDDGLHADVAVTVNGGDIQLARSYEALESALITINGGTIHLVSSDDGVNVVSATGGGGMRRPGQAAAAYTGSNYLYINGGYLVVDAGGDGLDSNGAIAMTGGVVLVNGPTAQMNGALDYDGGFTISGGLLVAAGSAGMAEAPGASSSQSSLLINYASTQPAGTLVHIQNSSGQNILTFAPSKDYQSLAFSSPALVAGETYTIYSGGSASGSATDGWHEQGGYAAGAEHASVTVDGAVTTIGQRGGRFRP